VKLGTRILLARRENSINQTELAKKAGLQPSYISQIESGKRTPTFKNLQKIAKALGKSLDYFSEDYEQSVREESAQYSSLKDKPIPVISWADAGKGQEFISDYPMGNGFDSVPRSFAEADPEAYAIQIVGDSMEPRFHPGDIVIASPALQAMNNDDVVARLKTGDVYVKRLRMRDDDSVVFKSYNSQMYDDIIVKREDIAVMHKIVGIIPK